MPLAVYPGYFIPFDIREVNNSHLPMMLNTSIPSPRKLCLAVLVIYDPGVHCIFGTSFSSEDFQKNGAFQPGSWSQSKPQRFRFEPMRSHLAR